MRIVRILSTVFYTSQQGVFSTPILCIEIYPLTAQLKTYNMRNSQNIFITLSSIGHFFSKIQSDETGSNDHGRGIPGSSSISGGCPTRDHASNCDSARDC